MKSAVASRARMASQKVSATTGCGLLMTFVLVCLGVMPRDLTIVPVHRSRFYPHLAANMELIMRRLVRALLAVLAVLAVALGLAGLWLRAELRASLPQLDGEQQVSGLSALVT